MLSKVKFQCVDHVTTKHLFRTLQLDIFYPSTLPSTAKPSANQHLVTLLCLIRFAGKTHIITKAALSILLTPLPWGDAWGISFWLGFLSMVCIKEKVWHWLWRFALSIFLQSPSLSSGGGVFTSGSPCWLRKETLHWISAPISTLFIDLIASECRADNHASTLEVCK